MGLELKYSIITSFCCEMEKKKNDLDSSAFGVMAVSGLIQFLGKLLWILGG